MQKALVGLFIGVAVIMPAFASAKYSPKPPKDTTPPSLTSIHIASSNADSSKAKAGDTVTLTFTTSEKVTPVVLVETKSLFVKARNTSGNSWDASYVVNAKDHTGRVDYLVAMVDAAKNPFICSSARIPFIKYCPTTDGSSVTIYKDDVPPPTDTQAPVMAAHADVHATTSGASIEVSYELPSAVDNVDGSVAVTCAPGSGSTFSLGTTTVTCTAQDVAGNSASSTFAVIVEQEVVTPPDEPTLYTMKSQPDQSYLCGEAYRTWRFCNEAASFSFSDTATSTKATIELGLGSNMDTGTIETVTIAKDAINSTEAENNAFHPWLITISCFTDAALTDPCADWSSMSDHASDTSDGKYWSADFSTFARTFNQDDYYVMTIDDLAWEAAVFGSESLQEPYWVITGLQ